MTEYRFRHGLVREAAYASLLEKHRRELHRIVGVALEELHFALLVLGNGTKRSISNPFATDKELLIRVGDLHRRLVEVAAAYPRQARSVAPKRSPVLERVTLVLELAGLPMRAREVHAAAEQGGTLRWSSVKAALAAGAQGDRPRFRRIRRGVYESGG